MTRLADVDLPAGAVVIPVQCSGGTHILIASAPETNQATYVVADHDTDAELAAVAFGADAPACLQTIDTIRRTAMQLGITEFEMVEWFAAGYTNATTVLAWQRAGTPQDVNEWHKAGVTTPTALRLWAEHGVTTPEQVNKWRQLTGKDITQARPWMEAGIIDPAEVSGWEAGGFNPASAIAMRRRGLNADAACAYETKRRGNPTGVSARRARLAAQVSSP